MKTTDQKGFTAVKIIIVIVLLGIVAAAGWTVLHKKNDAATSKNTTQAASTNSMASSGKVPNGYIQYTSNTGKFSFAYPKEWGGAKPSTSSSLRQYEAVTQEVGDIFIGSAQLTDRLMVSAKNKSAFTISTAKYGATLKPETTGGAFSWKVIDVNPADTTDKVGDTYPTSSFKNAHGQTIYDFYWQDEGTHHAVWVFAVGDKFITLTMPALYATNEEGPIEPSATDVASYKDLAKKVADTIQVQ